VTNIDLSWSSRLSNDGEEATIGDTWEWRSGWRSFPD